MSSKGANDHRQLDRVDERQGDRARDADGCDLVCAVRISQDVMDRELSTFSHSTAAAEDDLCQWLALPPGDRELVFGVTALGAGFPCPDDELS